MTPLLYSCIGDYRETWRNFPESLRGFFDCEWGYSALSWCSDVTLTINETCRQILRHSPYCAQNSQRILTEIIENITYCNVFMYRHVKSMNLSQRKNKDLFSKPHVSIKCPIQCHSWRFQYGQWLSPYIKYFVISLVFFPTPSRPFQLTNPLSWNKTAACCNQPDKFQYH